MDSYFNQLMEIQNSTDHSFFLLDQDSEPRFVIEADKRTIIIPAEFQFLGVKTDQRSEKIYFEVDRIFDDVDLSTKTCVIQYINAGTDDVDEGIYPVTELDTTTVPGKIVFKWEVDNVVCKYAGVVAFSVRFYEIDPETKLYTYCWNTIPENLPVLDGLNVSGSVTEDFPTELLEWNSRMAALNTEITNKISTADATMKADLKTAKGYMDGAQAARGGAEEAESRVKKIVAGNEAYTKAESDNVYAKSQVKESERGTSVEVYPEDGSNLAVTAYGFTEQAGSGDSSPNNLRAITNCGVDNYFVPEMLAPEVTWDAETKTLTKPSSTGIYYDIFNGTTGLNTVATNYIQLLPNTKYVFSAGACDTATEVFVVANDGTVSKITGNLANASIEAETSETGRITIRMYATGKSKATNLSIKKYNTEEIFDYVVSKSGVSGVTFLPLTAPLCEGDSVVSWVKSGCDKVLVLDGSQNIQWIENSAISYGGSFVISIPDAVTWISTEIPPVYSDKLNRVSNDASEFNQGVIALRSANKGFIFTLFGAKTTEAGKQYLAEHPITVWYRSTNYTEAADIPVSLETHQQAVLVLDGTEGWATAVAGAYYMFPSNLPKAFAATSATSAVSDYLTAEPTNDIAAGTEGFGIGPSGSIAVRLPNGAAPSAYMPNKPLTVVYQLANPITYAHPAVDIISNISDNDSVLISGQKEISVSYHKSLDKTIVELDNKSYSKQESDNIFAKALRGTSEAAKSISIHPDAGSNVIVTAHGFTKQEGESDASPVNIRKIVTGGSRVNLFKQVINKKVGTLDVFTNRGTITINGTGSSSSTAADYVNAAFELSAGKYSVSVIANKLTNGSEQPSFRIHYINSDGNNVLLGYVIWDKTIHEKTIDHPGGKLFFGIYTPNATFDNITVKVMLVPGETADKNFIPTVNTEYGIGIITSGDVKTEIASELIAPLCQGDTFITKMKSECDNMIVVDGKNKKVVDGGSTYFNVPIGNYGGVAGSIVYKNYGGGIYNSGPNLQLNRTDFGVYGNTPDEFNKYCQKNPLILWYKTPSYTEAKDMKISVERHSHALIKMNGTEGITIYWNGRKDEQLENGRVTFSWPMPYPYKTADSSGSKVSHFTNRSDITSGRAPGVGYYFAATRNIYICIDLNTINAVGETDDTNLRNKILQYLSQQYALGTPVTIEYQMNNSLTFAHDAIDLIANPDEEGALVITGESDGTVSAEYNKDITYAFTELQSAVLAAIANLSL